jgi:hypothetical protein
MRLWLVLLLVVGGCATTSTPTPKLVGNAAGGMMDLSEPHENEVVFATADKHCRQFGKRARITSGVTAVNANVLFDCI